MLSTKTRSSSLLSKVLFDIAEEPEERSATGRALGSMNERMSRDMAGDERTVN